MVMVRMAEKSLYERLGGVFPIAAVVNRFSDEVVKDQIAGEGSKNPALREWHTQKLDRLPGLKWMRTLWVCAVAGVLARTLDEYHVPEKEKNEVLNAFAAHKNEVTKGYLAAKASKR